LLAQAGVHMRQGFVEEEQVRREKRGASQGDALPFAAREGIRQTVERRAKPEGFSNFSDLVGDRLGLVAAPAEPAGEILAHGHVGMERAALKHHAHVPVFGRQFVDAPAVEVDAAGISRVESGDQTEESGLAAAGGADDDEQFPVGGLQTQVADGDDGRPAIGGGETFGQAAGEGGEPCEDSLSLR
jgi:hypothetical protein